MTPLQACTRFLCHFDEASGTFVDGSVSRRPETARVGFAPDTTAKFGARSVGNSDSTTARRVTFGRAITISSETPWSIDFWVRPTAFNPGGGVLVWNGYSIYPRPGVGLTPAGLVYVRRTNNNNQWSDDVSTTPLTLNEWQHVAVSQDTEGVLRVFLDGVANGVFSASVVFAGFSGSDFDFSIGGDGYQSTPSFVGQIDEVRVVVGFPQFGSPFTRPTAPYADIPQSLLNPKVATDAVRLQTSPVQVSNFKSATGSRFLLDVRDGGRGRILGTVKEKATPTNLPLARRVRLFQELTGRFVGETWSDPVTGNYAFYNIDHTIRYTVVTYDHINNYRAVIADNLLPEMTP